MRSATGTATAEAGNARATYAVETETEPAEHQRGHQGRVARQLARAGTPLPPDQRVRARLALSAS